MKCTKRPRAHIGIRHRQRLVSEARATEGGIATVRAWRSSSTSPTGRARNTGAQFKLPKLPKEMAENGETFYGRFDPCAKADEAA